MSKDKKKVSFNDTVEEKKPKEKAAKKDKTPKKDNVKYDVENYFFVDYENVKKEGLVGLQLLGKKDRVRIYYSSAGSMPIDLHLFIVNSKTKFEYVKVEFKIKNALDCMLLYELEHNTQSLKVRHYIILSRDSDFDGPINILKEKGINIFKSTSIRSSFDILKFCEEIDSRRKEVNIFVANNFDDEIFNIKREEIVEAIITSQSKNILNGKLCQMFPGATVSRMLKTLKPLIKELPTQ